MTAALLTTRQCPGDAQQRPGAWHRNLEVPMQEDSTSPPPDDVEAYRSLVKPGDAVETPDGEIWVVDVVGANTLSVTSAYRDAEGLVYADVYEQTRTTIPTRLARKVADARAVRRP